MENKLLAALQGKNRGRPPVWLMRQAGRYLPEYRELRRCYSLKELFFTPELAAKVTMMPIDRFGVDAAILFSDITVVVESLGFHLDFNEGPVISLKKAPDSLEPLSPIIETIKLLKAQLNVPLIGFCGAPFTIAHYIIENLDEKLQSFKFLLEKIADVTAAYLRMQVAAGVDAIQIFDSWANRLTPEQFRKFSLPYVERFCNAVAVPAIFFMRGAGKYMEEIPCAVSLDWETDLVEARRQTKKTIQGNLNPDLLFEPLALVREKTQALLESMKEDPAFILNLGHGVKPHTPVEAVECFVQVAQSKKTVV